MTDRSNHDNIVNKIAILIDDKKFNNKPKKNAPLIQLLFSKYFVDLDTNQSEILASNIKDKALEDIIIKDAAAIIFQQKKKYSETDNNPIIGSVKKEEKTLIELTNRTYKNILFCSLNSDLLNISAQKNNSFKATGQIFTSIKGLYCGIKSLSDQEFDKYANNQDFFKWLNGDAFKDNKKIKRLAKKIKKVSSKKQLRKIIEEHAKKAENQLIERKKEEVNYEPILAANMFLDMLNPDLHALIDQVTNKQDLKILLLVNRYVNLFHANPVRSELVNFLVNPFEFAAKNTELNIDREFNFAKYFKENIEFNKQYFNEIEKKLRTAKVHLAQFVIKTKPDFEKYSALKKEFENFVEKFKEKDDVRIKGIEMIIARIETELNSLKNRIDENEIKYSSALIEMETDVIPKAEKILTNKITQPALKTFIRAQNKLKNYQQIKPNIEPDLIENLPEFIDKQASLEKLIQKNKKRLTEFFEKKYAEYKKVIDTNECRTQQETDKILKKLDNIQKSEILAEIFYENDKTAISSIHKEALSKINEYKKIKTSKIKEIQEITTDLKVINSQLEKQKNNTELFEIDFADPNTKKQFNKITDLEKSISRKTRLIDAYSIDQGLEKNINEFKQTQKDTLIKIDNIKQKIKESIILEINKLNKEVSEQYDYSQEIILLKEIKQSLNGLQDLANLIQYSEHNQKIADIKKISDLKINKIQSNLNIAENSVSETKKQIQNIIKQIENKSKKLSEKGVVQNLVKLIDTVPAKIHKTKKWKKDYSLGPKIKDVQDNLTEAKKQLESQVKGTIQDIKDTLNIGESIVETNLKSESANILIELKKVKEKICNLNHDTFMEIVNPALEKVSELIKKAENSLQNHKKEFDTKLEEVVSELNIEFESSEDKEKIKQKAKVLQDLEQDIILLKYDSKLEKIESAKILVETKLTELAEKIELRKSEIKARIKENRHSALEFKIIKKGLSDDVVIESINKNIKKQKNNLNQHSEWKKDKAYAKLFKEGENELNDFRLYAHNSVLERINKKDSDIDEIFELAGKRQLSLSEFKKLNQSIDTLKQIKQNYLVFNKDIFKEVVAQKIEKVEETRQFVLKKINEISDHLDNQIEKISADISEDKFVYSQHLPALNDKEMQLKDILQFCRALENDALLESIEYSKNKIAEVRKSINNQFDERKTETNRILKEALDTQKSIEKLISQSLNDTNLTQAYLLLHESENSFKNIDFEWQNDDYIQEIWNDAESTIKEIRKSLEDNIFAEVTKIDAAAQQCTRVVDAAALQSSEEVKKFLAAEASLKMSIKNYSSLLKHEHKNLLSEKEAEISATLKTASNTISSLKHKLSEEVEDMEKQAETEHKYTQDKKKLEERSNKIISLSEFLKALNADEELARINTAKTKIDKKARLIDEKISEKRKELSALHDYILIKNKERLAKLWKDIHSENNLAEAHKLLEDARNKVHKQGRWRMDDDLTSVFSRIDEALNKLQDYQVNKVKTEINNHVSKLNNLEIILASLNISTLEQAKNFKKESEKLDKIKGLLTEFKETSQEYDTAFALKKVSDVAKLIEQRYKNSRKFVSELIKNVTNKLYETDMSSPQYLPSLKMLKSELESKKDMCSLISRDAKDVDFMLEHIDEKIEFIEENKSNHDAEFNSLLDNLNHTQTQVETLLETKMNKLTFETILKLIKHAEQESEEFFKVYKKEDLKQIDLRVNPVYAIETLLSEFFNEPEADTAQQIIDNMINQVTEKINSEMHQIDAQIKDYADEAYFTYDLNKLNMFKEKAANCLIKDYDKFNVGSFKQLVSEKRAEQLKIFQKIEKKVSDVYEYQKKKIAEIKSDKNDLISFISKSKYLARKISLKKEVGSIDLLTSPLYNQFIQLSLDFSKKTKQIDKQWTSLRFLPKKKDVFAKEYLENKNCFLVNDQACKEFTAVQKEACALIKEQLELYSNILMQQVTSEDSLSRLKQAYQNLRSERVKFSEFKKHLRKQNRAEVEGFADEYKNLIRKAVTILHPTSDEEKWAQRKLENLQSSMLSFNKNCSELFSNALDHPDKENIDKVINLDYNLRTIQEETKSVEFTHARGAYMRSLMQEILKNNQEYTRTFAENMDVLIQNINAVKNLKSKNISGTLSGGLRSAFRKATRMLTRVHKKENAIVDELEKIKQYHEGYLAD